MDDLKAIKKELRVMVDLRTAMQKQRLALDNRILAIDQKRDDALDNRLFAIDQERDDAPASTITLFTKWRNKMAEIEKTVEAEIAPRTKTFPIYPYLTAVKGINVTLAAKLISAVDIARANHVSSLWKHAGFGLAPYYVKDDNDEKMRVMAPQEGDQWKGKRPNQVKVHVITEPKPGWYLKTISDRPVKGWCLPFNRKLKTACYLVAQEFVLHTSPYKRIYDARYAHCRITNPDWTPAHRNADAKRVMIKVFLEHLWVYWRTLDGLPVGRPYVHDVLSHDTYFTPVDYGWPPLGEVAEPPMVAEAA